MKRFAKAILKTVFHFRTFLLLWICLSVHNNLRQTRQIEENHKLIVESIVAQRLKLVNGQVSDEPLIDPWTEDVSTYLAEN